MALLKKIITHYLLTALLISSFGYTVRLHGGGDCDEIVELKWGVSARQGCRDEMEDQHLVQECKGLYFFGVYDGHGGDKAAKYVKEHLHKNFFEAKGNTIEEKLTSAFSITDKNFLTNPAFENDDSGTTVVVALVDINTKKLFIAHAGDSRAVVMRDGEVLFATKDHKPEEESERQRIEDARGWVSHYRDDCPRVCGDLAVSRAIGDRHLKNWVIPDPDTYAESFNENDILVLACDGLWDEMSNKEVAEFVHERLSKPGWLVWLKAILARVTGNEQAILARGACNEIVEEDGNDKRTKLLARALRDEAYKIGSVDNISVLVVKFESPSLRTRLFKLMAANKNIILLSLVGVVTTAFFFHKLGCFSFFF